MIMDIQKKQVQDTFALLVDRSEAFAALFYNRLFEITPEYRHLFKASMMEQGTKLMQMLAVIIHGLNELETLIPAVQALASRHVGYGVRAEDYSAVGEALLWALEQELKEAFTPEVKNAWAMTYQTLANVMIAVAQAQNPVK